MDFPGALFPDVLFVTLRHGVAASHHRAGQSGVFDHPEDRVMPVHIRFGETGAVCLLFRSGQLPALMAANEDRRDDAASLPKREKRL